jgi:hypothetical protein
MKTTSTPSKKPLRCRLGMHKYTKRVNPENGQRYHACKNCEKMDPRSTSSGGGNAYVL